MKNACPQFGLSVRPEIQSLQNGCVALNARIWLAHVGIGYKSGMGDDGSAIFLVNSQAAEGAMREHDPLWPTQCRDQVAKLSQTARLLKVRSKSI